MTGLRVIAGGKDSARAVQRRYARPFLQKWIAAGQALARGEGAVKLQPAHVDLQNKLTDFPSANEFYCFPSQKTIGERMGKSERTARRLFADLCRAKLLAPKRRGLGKTAIWVFCIDGVPLGERKLAAQDRPDLAAQDRPDLAGKPSETESLEYRALECEPSRIPSPPPNTTPRAREAERLAGEVLAGLSPAQRKSHRWQGLSRWIAAKIEEGCEPLDVSTGILEGLDTLRGATPSSFGYFDKPIERARASRLKPLPGSTGQIGQLMAVSQSRLLAYVADRLDVGTAAISALGADWLGERHRQFVAQTIGMPEIVAAARQRLAELACDARADAAASAVRSEINSYDAGGDA
ncbi:MAG TPA: helix-turn-helix domain-containing protein [Pseudolabrys sp.]|nr:helix-turn-helix domain-containing protein [Pseudolabrys sp.]